MKMSHIRSKQVFVDFYTFVQLKKNVEIVRKKSVGFCSLVKNSVLVPHFYQRIQVLTLKK